MPTRPQIELTKEELDRAEIPMNHVLVRMVFKAEGVKSRRGVIIGWNTDTVYAEGDGSHSADLAEVWGYVAKIPDKLYFNPQNTAHSMDWDIPMELRVNDSVWMSVLETKNAVSLICEGVLYRSIPYQDCYVAKRLVFENSIPEIYTIPLNGYVLLQLCFCPVLGDLDHFSGETIDMTRGVIKFIGTNPKRYIRDNYTHIDDLRVGDEVLFDKKCPLFYLERNKSLACFSGDEQFWVVQRRRIAMVLKRNNDGIQ